MSNHLSEDQFAIYIAGRATDAEKRHVAECAECGAEFDRFRNAVSSFRSAIRDRVDARIASNTPAVTPSLIRRTAGIPKWRWALAAAVALAFILIPLLTGGRKAQTVVKSVAVEADPDALMRAVNLHLSRTVPQPMERMMALIPNDESINESGGVQ